jgi:large subunit ribosomal protein L21
MRAVVKIGTSQYLVQPGQEILVDNQPQKKGQLSFSEVLVYMDEGQIEVGQPFVKDARITASVIGQVKGDKVRVFKFKAKSRYRKLRGFTPLYTKIKIDNITLGQVIPAPAASEASSKPTRKPRAKKAEK